MSVIAFVAISFYCQIKSKALQELLDKQASGLVEADENFERQKAEADDLNIFMEKSIIYLAEKINLLEYDKRIMVINQSLGDLIKGKYIIMDLKLAEAR